MLKFSQIEHWLRLYSYITMARLLGTWRCSH